MSIYAVTGSASGIGKAVAENLIAQGHGVISIDLHDADITADLSKSKASFIVGSVLFVDGGHDATFRPDRF